MERFILGTASAHSRKYFMNPDFSDMPDEVVRELREMIIIMSETINGIFTVGFYDDGSVFLEASGQENDFDYDEIGAALEVDRLKSQKKQLINALSIWYILFRTGRGKKLRDAIT